MSKSRYMRGKVIENRLCYLDSTRSVGYGRMGMSPNIWCGTSKNSEQGDSIRNLDACTIIFLVLRIGCINLKEFIRKRLNKLKMV